MDQAITDIIQQELPAKECAAALNELGKNYQQHQQIDKAILCWEKSVECYGKPGFAQAQLMKAYNVKRRECSQAGDGAGVERYSVKIDGLMQQSKDALRYGF